MNSDKAENSQKKPMFFYKFC